MKNTKVDFNISTSGISTALIVFVILRLVGVIGWSWWWVLSPLWIGAALTTLMFIILVLIEGLRNV